MLGLRRWFICAAILLLLVQLTGCTTGHKHRRPSAGQDYAPNFHIDVAKISDAVPKAEPKSKYGNPPSYVAVGRRYYVMKSSKGYVARGIASWYGMKFHKVRTSSGELYDVAGMTAAHCTLPLPTYARVTNLQTGKSVVVKINDRGPFACNRILDLSYVAAVKLGVTGRGTALVEVRALDPCHPMADSRQAPAPVLEHRGHPTLYLQIGAFKTRTNAENLAVKVKHHANGFPVFIKTGGDGFYRVQIGPIPDVECSDALYHRLESAGLGRPIAAVQ